MDTYFFVEVEVEGHTLVYGPYLDFGNAAEIMMDCLPALVSADRPTAIQPKLTPAIKEYCLAADGWELVSLKAQEQLN